MSADEDYALHALREELKRLGEQCEANKRRMAQHEADLARNLRRARRVQEAIAKLEGMA